MTQKQKSPKMMGFDLDDCKDVEENKSYTKPKQTG